MFNLKFSITQTLDDPTDIVGDDIMSLWVDILHDWDYEVRAEEGSLIFTRDMSPGSAILSKTEWAVYTHKGRVEVINNGGLTCIKLHYTVDYWQELILLAFIICIRLSGAEFTFLGFSVIFLYFIYRLIMIRKNCSLLLTQLVDSLYA